MMDIQTYKNYLLENEVADNTLKNYTVDLLQLKHYCKKKCAKELTKQLMIEYKQHMISHVLNGRNLKTSTINKKITSLNIYFKWLNKQELILKPLKQQSSVHRESLTMDEFNLLLKYSKNEETRVFMIVVVNTGLRITEMCNLNIIDLDKELILIKNKGKEAYIALNGEVTAMLKTFISQHMKKPGTKIFNYSQSTYRLWLRETAGNAGVEIKKVYPHSFRHLFAKICVSEGMNLALLQQLMRHEDVKTTTIYTRYSTSEIASTYKQRSIGIPEEKKSA